MRRALLILVLLAVTPSFAAETTLFEDIGGREKIAGFTTLLIGHLKSDPRISHFFAESDMTRLHDRLTDYFCHVSGEQRSYRGANLFYAHKGLDIREADFDALAEDLEDAMDEAAVPYSKQVRLLALLAPLEDSIAGH